MGIRKIVQGLGENDEYCVPYACFLGRQEKKKEKKTGKSALEPISSGIVNVGAYQYLQLALRMLLCVSSERSA